MSEQTKNVEVVPQVICIWNPKRNNWEFEFKDDDGKKEITPHQISLLSRHVRVMWKRRFQSFRRRSLIAKQQVAALAVVPQTSK